MDDKASDTLLSVLPKSVQYHLKAEEFTVKHRPKSQILRQEDDTGDVFYIHYGRVRVTLYTEHGYKLSFTEIYAGQSFGELSAIDSMPRSATVQAIEETYLTRLPKEYFLELVDAHPRFSRFVMNQMCALIRRLNSRMYELSTLDGTHRIYSELLRIADQGEVVNGVHTINNPPTHMEIASRINSHREAVSRVYHDLRKDNILEKTSKKLLLRNLEVLEQRIEKNRAK